LFNRGDNAISLRRRNNDLLEYLPSEDLKNNNTIGNAAYDLKGIADIIGNDLMYG
jgi:hypothetical protein